MEKQPINSGQNETQNSKYQAIIVPLGDDGEFLDGATMANHTSISEVSDISRTEVSDNATQGDKTKKVM